MSGTPQFRAPGRRRYALTDSPVGQPAWIVEKDKEWTDGDRAPEDAVPRNRMLTNVMLYWLTSTAGSSARRYREAAPLAGVSPGSTSPTPMGVAVFAADIARPVRRLAEKEDNVVHWSEHLRGGHVAAQEQPDLFTGDVRALFRRFR